MKRRPEIEAWLHQRLHDAVNTFAGGSADAFGRLLGYTNGGSVRQSLRKDRPVQQAIIERARDVEQLKTWFDIPTYPPAPTGGVALQEPNILDNVVTPSLLQAHSWEEVVSEFQNLPKQFWVSVSNQSPLTDMGPGDSIEFEKGSEAQPGDVVIVKTAAGSYLMRRYIEIEPGVFRAEGGPGHAPLHSEGTGLAVVAYAVRMIKSIRRK